MLVIYRNVGESVVFTNEETNETRTVELISYAWPDCTLRVNGKMQIKTQPESFLLWEDDNAYMTVISIDRGVKFGIQAPKHIKISRG